MRRRGYLIPAAVALSAAAAFGQSGGYYRKHYVSLGAGGAMPAGQLRGVLDTTPVFRFGYGFRFHPNFQADISLDTVFHAAKVKDYYESAYGDLRIKDYQFLLPMGGRAVIPLARNRVLLFAGGGGAYLRYQERIRQPFGDYGPRLDCPVCRARDGWGYYGLVGASFGIGRYQSFRLGFTSRVVRGNTAGDALGAVPGIRTSDAWVNTTLDFTVSF